MRNPDRRAVLLLLPALLVLPSFGYTPPEELSLTATAIVSGTTSTVDTDAGALCGAILNATNATALLTLYDATNAVDANNILLELRVAADEDCAVWTLPTHYVIRYSTGLYATITDGNAVIYRKD